MSEKPPEISEKPSEISERTTSEGRMTTLDHAALMLHEIAEPRPVGDSVKAAITRAARAVNVFLGDREKLSYGRAEDLWRREARRIDAHELDAIRAAHSASQRARAERRDQALRAELHAAAVLADRLERLAAGCVPADDPALAAEIRTALHCARRTARRLRGHAAAAARSDLNGPAPPG